MPRDDQPPSADELPALVGDVVYEVNQLHFSAHRSDEIAMQIDLLNRERNAHIESMLIHARCLVDFFNDKPRKDDVVVSMYIPDWSPESDGGEDLAWLEDNLGRFIDKRVAHLTAHRQRVAKGDEARFTAEVVARVNAVIETFRSRLDPKRRVQFFGGPPEH